MRKRLSRNKVSVLWSIVFAIFWGYSQGIPQECLSYTVLGDADRHVDHGNTNSLCDSSIVTQWYRFTGAAGTAIPDTCPEINRCNTDAPGWLSEPHPTVAEGIVTKTVCYHWSGSCCLWSNTIDVLNCGDFYIYKLIPPPVGCNLRYCGTNAIVDPAIPAECSSSVYNELNEANRYWSNDDLGGSTLCDTDTIVSNQWYRFTGAAGTMMATYCIPKESCNTHRTAWINGDHPNVAYGLVSTTVCMHWGLRCCDKSYPVDIRNCSGYYVYKLQYPSSCSERYCGVNDENDACPGNDGSTECACPAGYAGSQCTDIDECAGNTHDCDLSATCTNTDGSFTCACNAGYTGDGNLCSDIDECSSNVHTCDILASCSNTEGSFTCSCNIGYTGDGQQCTDIDECAGNTHDCDLSATCTNTDGSFTCGCDAGYTNDGNLCSDIDECTANSDDCDLSATCANTDGSFTCACNAGYTGDGSLCSDIDECSANTHDCDLSATCTNTDGSFTCACNAGYTGDGNLCSDIDECAANTHNCHMNATCSNTDGSFNCTCNQGFSGNGQSCPDIDECATATHNCHGVANCYNNEGSFTCECRDGYSGDGIVNCEPVGDFSVSIRNISKDKYLATPVQRSLKTVLVAKIEGIEGINAFESVLEWRRVSEMELAASESSEGTLVSQGTNEWTINRRSIPAGIYQVKFTALYKVGDLASPQILNAFDYGFIEVVAAPLRAIIDEGSSARWGSVEIVTVDGSLSYDGDIGPGNYTGLNFTWSCLDAGDNSSTSYDCFGSFVDQGNVNFTAVKIDPSQLEFGKMYILRLTVSKDVRSSVAEMTFEIASGEIPRVSCRCFVDCGAIVSSSNKFRVTSECLNSVCDGATYQWQLEKLQPDSGVWEIVSNLDNITATPINASNIIIRPNTLLSNSQYRLQLTAKVPMQEAEGFAVLEFETAGKPFGGYCQSSATERDMQFTFECLEWQDKSTPITYEFRRGTKLISYGVSTKTDPILLSAGLPEENYRVQIDITIKNAVGEAVEETLILKVEPSSKLDPCHSAVEEVADNLNNLLLEMDEFLRNGEVIQGAQLALLVLASSRASHNTECGQSLPSHIQNNITCTVLIRFASITITAGSFQLTLLIGSVITAATEGNEQTCEGFNALEYTLNLTNNMVDLLGSALADLEEPFSAEIEEVARTSTECIKNVLKSTSGSGKEPKIGNSSESKANAEKALGQVEIIMDSISMRLVSSERQVIEMDELSISLSKVTSEKLDGMSVEEGPTQFRLPTNISQGAVGNIAAKMMTTAFNPFNWDSDNSSGIVRSSVCSLELSQDGTGTMNVSDLENDIEITIPINSDESESTEPENSFLKPYEMTVRSYYAELGKVPVSLSLSGLDKDAVVEVFIKFGSRPTVEDFDQNFTVALSVTCQNDSSDGEETKLPVMLNQLH
ncbi:uncharacterized protein LOC144636245 [Oculina patagonica]